MKIRHLFMAAPFFALFSGHLNAATYTVTNINDSGAGSLRQAIGDTAPGDTVNFGITGTIRLTSGLLVINKNLTVQGPGANLLSISGNYGASGFYFPNGVTAALDGVSVQFGGGITNAGTLSLGNSVVHGTYGISTLR